MANKEKPIIAFVHIEKAAGTTLNHILRSNFLFGHIDVRPFSPISNKDFSAADLRMVQLLNPFVRSISGHSIKPYIDLGEGQPHIKYITLFRDPLKRYMSNYVYWREKLNKEIRFEQYLDREDPSNFQTKKIAGNWSLEKAKQILQEKFFLVGIVEEFDVFLQLLKNKLKPLRFDPGYIKQNVSHTDSEFKKGLPHLFEKYHDRIVENNRVDMALYKFVVEELYPSECQKYGPGLRQDAEMIQARFNHRKWHCKRAMDYIYRKVYIDPIVGILRVRNHLPYKGSY